MSEYKSELSRPTHSLETVKNAKKYLPSFYGRRQRRGTPGTTEALLMGGITLELLVAFDIVAEFPENYSPFCAARMLGAQYCEEAEAEGYANDLCSYARIHMGYLRRQRDLGTVPPEAPGGGMGNPSFLISSGVTCDPRTKWFQTIATHFLPIPLSMEDPLSPPWDANVDDPRIVEHYKEQIRASLKAQVVFLEEQTGKKLDMDRLRKIALEFQEAHELWHETLELNKAVPCPMGMEDFYTAIIPQMFFLGTHEAVDFYRALRDEVQDRVERGVGVIPDEKYRLTWFGLPPWYNLGIFNWLESLGAVVVIETGYYPPAPQEVDYSDPIEGIVDRTWKITLWKHKNGSEACQEICIPTPYHTSIGSKLLLNWVDEYKLDGAIMNRCLSCRLTTVGQLHYKKLLENVGIPSLVLETDMTDPRLWSDAQVKSHCIAFLEVVANTKEGRQKVRK